MTSANPGRVKDIFTLRLYTRVARLGSFSAAARECGLSQSQSSRIIADLEATLGVRLLTRTTRAVVPTDAGSEFLARIEPILAALDDAEDSVRDGAGYRGTVRMSMPTSLGIREIIPRLSSFVDKHPDLHIQLLLEDRRQDLVRAAVDVAIRLGRQADSGATVQRIASIPRVIVASPAYLDRFGTPGHPNALADHRIVGGPASAVPNAWKFERHGETVTVDLEPGFSTNENEGAIAAAVAGLGVTSTSAWACRREMDDHSLVRLLPDWTTIDIPVFAFYPMGRATRAVGRALVDHLQDDLQKGYL